MIDKIYIKNFRNLDNILLNIREGLTVIRGNNGVGKSTLIEALLFVLFGKINSKTTFDTLFHMSYTTDNLKRTHRPVVACDIIKNNITYRVIRSVTHKGSTEANIISVDNTMYSLPPIEDAMPQKQYKNKPYINVLSTSPSGVTVTVTGLLGVSADGFASSFIAKQKELDILAGLTPDKRKKLFIDLLGYSAIFKLKKDIRASANEQVRDKKYLETHLVDINELNNIINDKNSSIDTLNERIKNGKNAVEKTQILLDNLQSKRENLLKTYNEYSKIQGFVNALQDQYSIINNEIIILKNRVSELEYRLNNINKDELKELDELEIKVRQLSSLIPIFKSLSMNLKNKELYIHKKQNIEDNKKQLEDELHKQFSKYTDYNVNNIHEEFDKINNNIIVMSSRIIQINNELSIDITGAICPTCGMELNEDNFRKHRDGLESERDNLTQELSICNDKKCILSSMIQLKNNIDDCEKNISDINDNINMIDNDINMIFNENSDYSSDELINSANNIDNIITEYQLKSSRVELLDQYKNDFREYEQANNQLDKKNIELNMIQDKVNNYSNMLKSMVNDVNFYQTVSDSLIDAEHNIKVYNSALNDLNIQLSKTETELNQLNKEVDEYYSNKSRINELELEITNFEVASEVIDIIEASLPTKFLPALSREASRLLNIATGGVYNTLVVTNDYDIFVQGEYGEIPIHMMSGGEQDIIALVVRIAISHIMISVNNMGPQVFILDEVFGSLDQDRKWQALDALNNLQKVIPSILCVTHIEEIKQAADHSYLLYKDDVDGFTRLVEER